MRIILALCISVLVNLDNMLIGIQLGIKGKKIWYRANVIIACITGLCTVITVLCSQVISSYFKNVSNMAGALLFFLFGVYCLLTMQVDERQVEEEELLSNTKTALLGLILALNSIPPAISAGMLGINGWWLGLFCGVSSYLAIGIGNKMALASRDMALIKWVTPFTAGFFILIGLWNLFF